MTTPLKVTPKLDLVFKKVFGDVNNSDLLISFLSSVLDIDKAEIQDVEIINNEIIPDTYDQKFSRLDLLLKTSQGGINIEIQVDNRGDYTERTLFYWAKSYTTQLEKGKKYSNLQPTISINIIDFNLFDDAENSQSTFQILETTRHTLLNDKLRMDFLELPKAKETKTRPDLQEWLDFLNVTTEEGLDMLETNKNTSPEVKKAVCVIKEMSADEKTLYEIEERKKWKRDEAAALAYARDEGIAKGRAEGEAKGRAKGKAEERNDIFKMLKGMSEEERNRYINNFALQ